MKGGGGLLVARPGAGASSRGTRSSRRRRRRRGPGKGTHSSPRARLDEERLEEAARDGSESVRRAGSLE